MLYENPVSSLRMDADVFISWGLQWDPFLSPDCVFAYLFLFLPETGAKDVHISNVFKWQMFSIDQVYCYIDHSRQLIIVHSLTSILSMYMLLFITE